MILHYYRKILCAFLTILSLNVLAANIDKVIAIVDEDVILQSEFDNSLQEVLANLRDQGLSIPTDEQMHSQVLERLILEKIQLNLANQYNIEVENHEVMEAIEKVATENGISDRDYIRHLSLNGKLSAQEVIDNVKNQMRISRLRQSLIAANVRPTEQDVKSFLDDYVNEISLDKEYHLASILIPMSQNPTQDEMLLTYNKIEDIYNRLKNGEAKFETMAIAYSVDDYALKGGDMGWRSEASFGEAASLLKTMKNGQITSPIRTPTGFILLKMLDIRGGDKPFLQQEVNVRHILIGKEDEKAELKIQAIYRLLTERNQDFAIVAKKFSTDKGSAKNGGELGLMNPDDFVLEFAAMAKKMKPGIISKPFKTDFGWHILEVLDKETVDITDDLKKEQAMHILYNKRYEEELQIWLQRIREEAYVKIIN